VEEINNLFDLGQFLFGSDPDGAATTSVYGAITATAIKPHAGTDGNSSTITQQSNQSNASQN